MGLLLDTFIVRTLVVPACAALLGPWLWWPGNRHKGEEPTGLVATRLLPSRQG
jgi:RND superfamily putative drug exporter